MGLSYKDVQTLLGALVEAINGLYSRIFDLLGETDWFEGMLKDDNLQSPISAVKGVAITLCLLFFLMDFFRKTMDLQWVKWENVLMLFIKLVLAKVCIENTELICNTIFNGFSSLVSGVSTPGDFIPKTWDKEMGGFFMLSETDMENINNGSSIAFFDMTPTLLMVKIDLMAILQEIILFICIAIVFGRMFELIVYTIIAPIPIATFASDGLSDIGKGFLKSYAAVCLQAVVLVIMFDAFLVINTYLDSGNAIMGLLKIFALALCVMQSGAWAKRICGAM